MIVAPLRGEGKASAIKFGGKMKDVLGDGASANTTQRITFHSSSDRTARHGFAGAASFLLTTIVCGHDCRVETVNLGICHAKD
jgi:hypothetical protein